MGTPERKNNTATWIAIYLTIVVIATLVGLLVGGLYYWMTPAKFRCDATFRLAVHPAMLGLKTTVEHEKLIVKSDLVNSVMESNGLYDLESFADVTNEQALQNTLSNLQAVQNSDEPSIYEVTLHSKRPEDAQAIVDKLIAGYGKELEQTVIPASESAPSDPSSGRQAEADAKDGKDPEDQLAIEFMKRIRSSGQIPASKLELLQPATSGQVWPQLPVILGVTGSLGLLAGFALVVLIFMISYRARNAATSDK